MNPTVIVAAAVVRHEERVLITQRVSGAHLGGMWEFPGGKLEPGEGPEIALVRECREECGIEIRVLDILDVVFHAYEKKNVLLLFYACELVSGEVQHLEVAAHAWCLPSELDNYDFPPPDVRVLQKLKSGR